MDPSETNSSFTSSFAKNRFPPDDDTDNYTEPHPFPKDVAPQWDQQPAPLDPQRPARKWWQGVRIQLPILSYPSPFPLPFAAAAAAES